jgi:hypothetical protein
MNATSAGGTLQVTDGAHTANIALLGNYMASVFITGSDGHGGTTVHDPQVLVSPLSILTGPSLARAVHLDIVSARIARALRPEACGPALHYR